VSRPASPCSVQRTEQGDLELVTVRNGRLQLVFLPQVGGRLISLEVDGAEVLWRNPAWLGADLSPTRPHASWPRPDGTMGSWVNAGGAKTWPAPQGWSGPREWAGPPDDVLDAGRYALDAGVRADGTAVVRLTSGVEPRTGLQVTRAVELAPGALSFTQTSTFTNPGDVPVRWAVWEVAQVDTRPLGRGLPRGAVVVGTGPGRPWLDLLEVTGRATATEEAGRVVVPVQDVVAKLGFPAATGRVEWQRGDGLRLAVEIAVTDAAEHPDGGCPVELWLQHPIEAPLAEFGGLHPDAHLVELEVLGPLRTLAPGASSSLTSTWTAAPAGR